MEGTRLNLTMAKRVGSKMGKKPVRISNHGIWSGQDRPKCEMNPTKFDK